jgi:hypothetical protein
LKSHAEPENIRIPDGAGAAWSGGVSPLGQRGQRPGNQQPFQPQKSTKETQKKKQIGAAVALLGTNLKLRIRKFSLKTFPEEQPLCSNSFVLLLCSFVAKIVSG